MDSIDAAQAYTRHYILTLHKPGPGGPRWATASGTVTPAAGATRDGVFKWILNGIIEDNPDMRGGTVLFFSLEPNRL
ncbi:hypothetical protein ACIQGZ_17080 [Streptomyces sp. NPDC092296]|uniref:hypothetical protein n=1 Tax=Streptomyces sp. NPDC092296 TaxID=3366012 RepID=UPI0038141CA8